MNGGSSSPTDPSGRVMQIIFNISNIPWSRIHSVRSTPASAPRFTSAFCRSCNSKASRESLISGDDESASARSRWSLTEEFSVLNGLGASKVPRRGRIVVDRASFDNGEDERPRVRGIDEALAHRLARQRRRGIHRS